MEIVAALLPQIMMMFIIMGIGYVMIIKKLFTEETMKQLSWFLVNIVIPCVLFTSFLREFQVEEFKQFFLAFLMSVVGIGIGIVYSNLFFKKEDFLEKFAIIFSNASFIGIPIILSLFGHEALFFLSAYIVAFVLSVFTYGVYLISQKSSEIQVMKIIKNPNVIAIVLGFILYVLSVPIPGVLVNTMKSIGSMNTPLSMILLGAYLAKDKLHKLISNVKCYQVSLGRLVVVPLLTIGALYFFPGDGMLKMIVVVVNSVPSAVMLALFAELYDQDAVQGAQYVSFTTLACLITLPLIVLLGQWALL